jgi:copper chaperone
MITFEVNDMTCGHCVGAITGALKAIDPEAAIRVDLATHRVQVGPVRAGAEAVAAAIRDAGYTPVPVEAAAGAGVAPRRGACCGGCH